MVRFALLAVFPALVASCDEVERRKVLTMFFDGVPPSRPEGLREERVGPDSKQLTQMRPGLVSLGRPRKCTLCHSQQRQKGFPLQTGLAAPVPELCYGCHNDHTVSAPYVHGPVSVGQCLLCHDQHHNSEIEHLLKEPLPKLCYLCHDINALQFIPAHLMAQTSACTDCHDAHASSAKALLKEAPSPSTEELDRAKAVGEVVQDRIQVGKEQREEASFERAEMKHTTVLESERLLAVFREVSRLIEQGELQKARAYLEELRDSNAFTDEERGKIAQVLRLIDTAATRTQRNLGKVERVKSVGERKPEEPAAQPQINENQLREQMEGIAKLYYRCMTSYGAGQLAEAREGFVRVLKSGLVPPPMAKTIRGYLLDIDNTLAERGSR